MMQYFLGVLFLGVGFFSSSIAAEEIEHQVDLASENLKISAKAAEDWLHLIDTKKYVESWTKGSLTLRLTLPKQHWVSLMEKLRKPYGSFISRSLVTQRPSKDPENLPKGDYMVAVFSSSFSRRAKVNELVTLVQESDGRWRVLTYIVQ